MTGSSGSRNASRRRRRRSRSRRRRHEHRDRKEDQDAGSSVAAPQAFNVPPAGWHGNVGTGPPPWLMHPASLPPGAPSPFGPPPFPPMRQGPPQVAYPNDAIRDNLYTSPFSAVPPPPNLDDGSRKGGKGKGSHTIGYEQEPFQPKPDGLIASNVPVELNTLDSLNRHFRQFGEVLKITVQASEGKAFIQFAESSSADNAASAVVLGRPEISLAWAQRAPKGKEKGKGKDRPTHLEKPAEHRVLCSNPDEQRRMDECKRKRDEITSRRTALLANLTEQLKKTMSKLNDKDVPESKQEALRAIVLQIKEKMNTLSGNRPYEEVPSKDSGKGEGKSADGGGKGKLEDGGRFTLDLRPKALRVKLKESWSQERLREELTKIGAPEEKIISLVMEDSTSDGQQADSDTATVHFKDRRTAENIFNLKGELPFSFEWCASAPPVAKEPTIAGTLADTSGEAKSEDTAPQLSLTVAASGDTAAPSSSDAPKDDSSAVAATTSTALPAASDGAVESGSGRNEGGVAEEEAVDYEADES